MRKNSPRVQNCPWLTRVAICKASHVHQPHHKKSDLEQTHAQMLVKLKITKAIMSPLKDQNGNSQMKGFDYYNKVRVSMTIYLWKQPTPSATT